jgi:hypothetical protein
VLDIVIPTRGRSDLKLTCDALPKSMRDRIFLVCPSTEVNRHRDIRPWATLVKQPDDSMTIAAKRAWIMREWKGADRIVMLDDDLRFFVKRDGEPTRLRGAEDADVTYWFGQLESKLTASVPHAGFSSRLFNNAKPPGWERAKRMQYVLGYFLPTVREHCDLSGRIETREDMDYVLQLLEKGYPNEVCFSIAVEQSNDYGARGGCHGQRTTASSDADAEQLAQLHPGIVRVVQKDYKGNPRKEVVVRWEAALRSGKERMQHGSGSAEARTEVHSTAEVHGRADRRRSR